MSKKRLSRRTIRKRKKICIAIAIVLALSAICVAGYFLIGEKDPAIGTWSDKNCTLVMEKDGTFKLTVANVERNGTWQNLEAETKAGAETKVEMYRLVVNDVEGMVGSGFLSENGEFTIILNVKGEAATIKFTKEK